MEPVDLRWVPRDTVWAKVFVRWGDEEAITAAFLGDLAEFGAAEVRLPPGDYYWFTVDERGHASTETTPPSIPSLTRGRLSCSKSWSSAITRSLATRFTSSYRHGAGNREVIYEAASTRSRQPGDMIVEIFGVY